MRRTTQKYFPEYARIVLAAIAQLIKKEHSGKIFIPEFICDVVPETFRNEGLDIIYYQSMNPYCVKISDIGNGRDLNNAAILVVNYFGMKQNLEEFYKYCESGNVLLIVDNSQCLYKSEQFHKNVISIYSLRKFYYGGTSLADYDDSDLKIDLNLETTKNRMGSIKLIFNGHTNIVKLDKIMRRKYARSFDLFNPYLDKGYIQGGDTIPIGIPLALKNFNADIKSNDYGECYIWPNYYDNMEGHKVLVFPVHSIKSRRSIKNHLQRLVMNGVI